MDNYTFETMPDYHEIVEEAHYIEENHPLGLRYLHDIVYMKDLEENLHLQIIKPERKKDEIESYPCIVFVQGSAWQKQDVYHNIPYLSKIAAYGYVVAIVEYLPIQKALIPRQVVECKNAIRFLKKNSKLFSIDKNNIILMGDSSGGHTAVLAGLTQDKYFDDPINQEDLSIKGIIDLYGAVHLTMEHGFPSINLNKIDGIDINKEILDAMELFNCFPYLNHLNVPMLIVHGTKDHLVNVKQSIDLFQKAKALNKEVELYLLKHIGHGGPQFWEDKMITCYVEFIRRCLK